VLYRLKFSHASTAQIDRIQHSLCLLLVAAKKAGLTAAAHKVLFGGYMGCGWNRWTDEVNLERMKMMLQGRSILCMAGPCAGLPVHQLQVRRGESAPVMERRSGVSGDEKGASRLGQLWLWRA
jgi:hypothetical protein